MLCKRKRGEEEEGEDKEAGYGGQGEGNEGVRKEKGVRGKGKEEAEWGGNKEVEGNYIWV